MLLFHDAGVSVEEVPGHKTLCFYLTGCLNHCKNCHYPELRDSKYGECLKDKFNHIVELYIDYISCVAFMGEGTIQDRDELISYAKYVQDRGLKNCLYCGRNVRIEEWMSVFDYIKTGAYIEKAGPLTKSGTNQRMFYKDGSSYVDITYRFWNA